MKAISLWEPWATLMKLRVKPDETRHWPTSHRGWLAIHAAKKVFYPDQHSPQFIQALREAGAWPMQFGYGNMLCIVYLTACAKTQSVRKSRSQAQLAFGDYSDDRYAWVTNPEKTIALPQAVPFRGVQGLFEWPEGDLYIPKEERQPEGLFA